MTTSTYTPAELAQDLIALSSSGTDDALWGRKIADLIGRDLSLREATFATSVLIHLRDEPQSSRLWTDQTCRLARSLVAGQS